MEQTPINYSNKDLITITNFISRRTNKKFSPSTLTELKNILHNLPINTNPIRRDPKTISVDRNNSLILDELTLNFIYDSFENRHTIPLNTNISHAQITPMENQIKLEEILKRDHNISNLTYSNLDLIERKLVLDSRFRSYDSNNQNKFEWVINSTQFSVLGKLRSSPLCEIKKIEGYAFTLPYSDISQLQLGSVKINFSELSKDSYGSDIFNQDFHIRRNFNLSYLCDPVNISTTQNTTGHGRVLLRPNPAICVFNTPISNLDTISIEFLTPDGTLNIPNCFISPTIRSGNPTIFTLANHGLNNGDIIFINNLNSPNNQAVQKITRISGWPINLINTNTFSIAFDSTEAVFTNTTVNVCINKFRFVLEISLLCLS